MNDNVFQPQKPDGIVDVPPEELESPDAESCLSIERDEVVSKSPVTIDLPFPLRVEEKGTDRIKCIVRSAGRDILHLTESQIRALWDDLDTGLGFADHEDTRPWEWLECYVTQDGEGYYLCSPRGGRMKITNDDRRRIVASVKVCKLASLSWLERLAEIMGEGMEAQSASK